MSKYPTSALATAKVEDLTWLVGSWRGEKNGEYMEEHWSGPLGPSLMGMFCWMRDGKAYFYELVTMEQSAEGIFYHIKHFNPGLTGWEEKDKAIVFVLVGLDGKKAVFSEVASEKPLWSTYELLDNNTLLSYFEREDKELSPEDEFRYTRFSL